MHSAVAPCTLLINTLGKGECFMNTEHQRPSILLWEFFKFALFFLVLYYLILFTGGYFLKIRFISSTRALGYAGGQIVVTYLIGIQLIGIGFGWLGYGMAAIFRENPQSVTKLFFRFLSKGPFQRTGKPSWQTTAVLFPMMFYLGYLVSAFWLHAMFEIDSQLWKSWIATFPVGRAFILLGIAPIVPVFIACRALCPEMTAEEFYWRND